MLPDDIHNMILERGKPCISIILPTPKRFQKRNQNQQLIENAILKAGKMLRNSAWPENQVTQLQIKLDLINKNLDYRHLQEGFAAFISPGFYKQYILPFSVEEKVILGKNFEIRDLVYFNQFLQLYFLLTISKTDIHLFEGHGSDLKEVVNNDFPREYVEEYEYAHSSVGSSTNPGIQSFEKDKSVLQKIRRNNFFKQTDYLLQKYINEKSRLLIAGVDAELADFTHLSNHKNNIAGKMSGNRDINLMHSENIWMLIRDDINKTNNNLVQELEENIGKNLAVDGIKAAWPAAYEGKGRTLLLEKDYRVTCYLDTTRPERLFLSPPIGSYDIIHDAADDVIEMVLEKGGDIRILENGDLDKFNRIALMLRY